MKKTSNVFYGIIIALGAFLCLAYIMLLNIGEATLKDERTFSDTDYESYNDGWVWEHDDRTVEPIVPGCQLNVSRGQQIILKKTITTFTDKDAYITFNSAKHDVDAYVNGRLIYSYNTHSTRLFGEYSTDTQLFIPIHPSDEGKELMLIMRSRSDYSGVIDEMYIGTQMAIIFTLLRHDQFQLLSAMFMLVIGIFAMALGIYSRVAYKRTLSISFLGWAIYCCGIWVIAESSFRQFLVPNFSLFSQMSYVSIMLLPLAFGLYFDCLQQGRYRMFYMVLWILSLVENVVAWGLQYAGKADLVNSLVYSFILLGLNAAFFLLTSIPEALQGHLKSYWLEFIGIVGCMSATFAQVLSYRTKPIHMNANYICVGLIFLVIMAGIRAFNSVLRMEHAKAAAVEARTASNDFLARMSHEMRTPINAILGMNKMILRESSEDNILDYARDVNNAGNNLLTIVNEILDLSKVTSGKVDIDPYEYDLMDMLRECYSLISPRTKGSRLAFTVEVSDVMPSKVFGDRERMVQIITNLLSNAVKYTPQGRVSLEVDGKIKDGKLWLMIEVSDTGVGIPTEELPHIFDTYNSVGAESVTDKIEGSGLGLAITKQLVELMEGTISVTSELGKGTTFICMIPQGIRSVEPCGTFSMGPNGDRRTMDRNLPLDTVGNILIVDDVAINLRVFLMLLKNTSINVDTARSGFEALDKMAKTKYDLIFLDHLMPGMDGIETKREMDAMTDNPNKDTPIIMQTANAIIGAREQYMELGFADYISKPIKEEVLKAMLKKYLK